MMQKEFEELVGMTITADEYEAIEKVYLNSDVDKAEFAKAWKSINRSRIQAYKKRQAEIAKEQKRRETAWRLVKKYGFGCHPTLRCFNVMSDRELAFLATFGIDEFYYLDSAIYEMRRYATGK